MPTVRIGTDLDMHYEVNDYSDPWREPETVLMLHGSSESSASWYGWVPHLARHFRVVRPDMRGFGASTPMPSDYAWQLDRLTEDFAQLMRTLEAERFHLVGAKIAGTIARHFAARYPDRVRTLVLVGSPAPRRDHKPGVLAEWIKIIEERGVEDWARSTMAGRLGSKFPPEGLEWWAKLMGATPKSTLRGFVEKIPGWDVAADLPRIACPTLVISTEGSALGSVDEVRTWQQKIPRSTLLVLPGDSIHVAASDADRCAQATKDFILARANMNTLPTA